MKYSQMKNMINKAFAEGYAIPAINVSNMETVTAVLSAAASLNAPIIVQVSPMQKVIQGFEYSEIVQLIHMVSKRFDKGEYTIHLDHSNNYKDCIDAVRGGFDSIMYDGAELPYEENIGNTESIRKISQNVTLEGELGILGGAEGELYGNGKSHYTNPENVAEFIKRTGVDCLAVSIGNAHGLYHGNQDLDMNILSEINKYAGIPLVLHGASGVPHESIRESIKRGISKINFFTELDVVFKSGLLKKITEDKYSMEACRYAQDSMTEAVKKIIQLCIGGENA